MSGLAQIKALYAYNEWADGHVMDAASKLTDDQYTRDLGASFGSVRGNLSHIVGAQILWLARFNSSGGNSLPKIDGDLAAIRRLSADVHTGLHDLLALMDEDDLSRVLSYVDTQGNAQQHELGPALLHLVNHGTHHRAETALLLTSLGHAPRQLDYLFFELERAGGPPRLT
ncbi:MAG: DinB family protein [Chloroflexi bacterium]|nr:DinB family protein [Chloroflexota bacterium]